MRKTLQPTVPFQERTLPLRRICAGEVLSKLMSPGQPVLRDPQTREPLWPEEFPEQSLIVETGPQLLQEKL